MKRSDYIFDKQDERYDGYKSNSIWKELAPIMKQVYEDVDFKLKRPDLLGKTVKASLFQFSNIYNMVADLSDEMGIDVPDVYVYEDFYYGVESFGVSTYWIEISAKSISDLKENELRFILAREIFKISEGITREVTLINQLGSAVPYEIQGILRLEFNKWYRCTNFSADNYGYLCCKNLSDAVHAILKLVLNSVVLAEEVDVMEFMKQTSEINRLHDKVYNYAKLDETVPYAPFRIKNLFAYAVSERGMKCIR